MNTTRSSKGRATLGPWTAKDFRAGSWHLEDRNGWPICSRLSTVKHTEQESYANARLIAAAPDMLDELENILAWATTEKAPLRQQEIESIRATLRKASEGDAT